MNCVPTWLYDVPARRRSGYNPGGLRSEDQHHALIMVKGGPEDTEREIEETFDFWVYVTDLKIILAAADDRIIIGESLEELTRKVNEKYPAPANCSYLKLVDTEIHYQWKEGENCSPHGYRRRRESRYDKTDLRGFVVLKYPLVTDFLDLDQVRSLCVTLNKAVLLEATEFCISDTKLMDAGFSPVGGGFGLTKVRWNPKTVALRQWRHQVEKIEEKFLTEYEATALNSYFSCFNPKNWPNNFPFKVVLSNENPNKYHFKEYMKLAELLKPGSMPWRQVSTFSSCVEDGTLYKQTLSVLLPYARYILKHGSRTDRRLTLFLMKEAKALKLVVPPTPVRPTKPFARKPKKIRPSKPSEITVEVIGTTPLALPAAIAA